MALPRRKQSLAKFIKFHELTRAEFAQILGTNVTRVANLCAGITYPTPDEIATVEHYFGLPIEVFFEEEMLEFRYNWPPPRGFQRTMADFRRFLKAEAEAKAAEAGE